MRHDNEMAYRRMRQDMLVEAQRRNDLETVARLNALEARLAGVQPVPMAQALQQAGVPPAAVMEQAVLTGQVPEAQPVSVQQPTVIYVQRRSSLTWLWVLIGLGVVGGVAYVVIQSRNSNPKNPMF